MDSQGTRHAATKVEAPAPTREATLGRTCACGNHTLAGGECESCRKKRQTAPGGPAQPPLASTGGPPPPPDSGKPQPSGTATADKGGARQAGRDFSRVPVPQNRAFSAPGDAIESEANRLAAAAMRRTRKALPVRKASSSAKQPPLPVMRRQRRPGDDERWRAPVAAPEGIAPAEWDQLIDWLESLDTGGQPLPPEVADFFEARFGLDLSPVRIHKGPDAAAAADTAAARAFTWGPHLIFASGAYAPETELGRRLLAHELAHVFQQTAGTRSLPVIQRAVAHVPALGSTEIPELEPVAVLSNPLLVEDDVAAGPNQLHKGEFLSQLQDAVCRTAEEALAGTGWTTQDCPTLRFWFSYYSQRDASQIERAVRRFVPGAANAQTAAEYIPDIVVRVRRGVEEWARSGRITEVPDELAAVAEALAPPRQPAPAPAIQRKGQNGSGATPLTDPEVMRERLGPGHPLDSGLRSRMETAFGTSFAHVRAHTDAGAAGLANEVDARAFTVGEHVAFASGEYRPGTPVGDALIAHELVHTLQQERGLAPETAGVASEGALEHDADRSAVGAVAALWAAAQGLPLNLAAALRRIPQRAMPALRSGLQLSRCGFMVPNVLDILHQESLEYDDDLFYVIVAMDSKAFKTAGKEYRKAFNIEISYGGEDDAKRDSVRFLELLPDTGGFANPTIKRTQKEVKAGDGTTTLDITTIDVYGDASFVATLTHRTYLVHSLEPPVREHEFCYSASTDPKGSKPRCLDIAVREWDAEVPKPTPVATETGTPAPTPGLETAKLDKLPTSALIEVILARLAEIKPSAPDIANLEENVRHDLGAPTGVNGQALRTRVQELNDALVAVGPVFTALAALGNEEDYLSGIANKISLRVSDIRGLYISALEAFYAGDKDREEKLATAEKAMAAFPDYIVKLYLSEDGIEALANQAQSLRLSLRQLRTATGRGKGERKADLMIRLAELDESKTLDYEIKGAIRRANDMRWKKEAGVDKLIQELTYNAQVLIALLTTLLLYEQFIYWEQKLDDSIIDWLYDPKLGRARTYRDKLDAILKVYEQYGTGKTAEENQAFIRQGIGQVRDLMATKEYTEAVEAIQDRLKTIATINVIGKVALIVAAAALTAGAAGAAVGGLLEAAGATGLALKGGVFVAEVLAFTIASQAGQTIAFGKPSDDFLTELAWNAAMFGVAKAAVGAYGRVFKILADPKAFKITFEVGKIAVAAIALQGFAEAQHGLRTGKAMTGEERFRSILQNIILTVALEAGRFVTKPLEARVGAAIGAKLKPLFAEQLEALKTDRAALLEKLGKVERHQATQEQVEQILRDIQDLWTKELKLLSDAVKRHALTEAEALEATSPYKSQIAGLELRLSQLGVQAQVGAEGATFRPLERGVVAYKLEGRAAMEEYYRSRGGTLKDSSVPDMLVGRLPSGELTFYIADGVAPINVASAAKIAVGRDVALREAAGDAIAAEGLKRLEASQGSGGLGLGGRKADEVLANVRAEDMNAFLRTLKDPAFNMQLGAGFFSGLAERPDALSFARDHGADLLAQLYKRYGKQWSPSLESALSRARSQLEATTTPDAYKKLREDLLNAADVTKLETLLGNPPPPKPPRPSLPTKKDMGIDRSRPAWAKFRSEAQKFATDHGETLTSDQLDLRADGDQVIEAARRGGFDRLGRESKLDILDRWEALARKSGMQQTWIVNKKGILSEAMFLPVRGLRKIVFKGGVEVPWGTTGATIPDYSIPQQGYTERVNMKSDSISSGPKSGDVYQSGRAAATAYKSKAIIEAGNLPKGDKYSLDFIRDPGPETRNAMLKTLFAADSPIHRVKFGDTWYER